MRIPISEMYECFACTEDAVEHIIRICNIGQKNITAENEIRIGHLLANRPENNTIAHDLLLAPVWMRELINRNRKKQA